MRVCAVKEIEGQVWSILAEPFHLPDWWPGYTGVVPDRRGLAAGARWQVSRTRAPGLLRSGGGEGLIVLERVEPGRALAWTDIPGRYRVAVDVVGTRVSIELEASPWRLLDLRSYPRQALGRLERLCETGL